MDCLDSSLIPVTLLMFTCVTLLLVKKKTRIVNP